MSLRSLLEIDDTLDQFHAHVDEYTELNRQGINQTFEMIVELTGMLMAGRPYSPQDDVVVKYNQLKGTLSSLIDAYLGFVRYGGEKEKKRAELEGKLGELHKGVFHSVEFMDFLFRLGYHSPMPVDGLRSISSVFKQPLGNALRRLAYSKPEIRSVGDIETFEEFIRYMHAEMVEECNNFVKYLADFYEDDFPSTEIRLDRKSSLFYFGEGEVSDSPMRLVADAITEYFEEKDYVKMEVEQSCMTDRGLFMHLYLRGEHRAFFEILYNKTDDRYALEFTMMDPRNHPARIAYSAMLFPLMGFHSKPYANSHVATRNVYRQDLKEAVQFVLFVAESLKNYDKMGIEKIDPPSNMVGRFRELGLN